MSELYSRRDTSLICETCGAETIRKSAMVHRPDCPNVQGIKGLTTSELDVVLKIGSGMNLKEIAASRHCATRTISSHLYNIMQKLGVHNRAQLIRKVIEFEQRNP